MTSTLRNRSGFLRHSLSSSSSRHSVATRPNTARRVMNDATVASLFFLSLSFVSPWLLLCFLMKPLGRYSANLNVFSHLVANKSILSLNWSSIFFFHISPTDRSVLLHNESRSHLSIGIEICCQVLLDFLHPYLEQTACTPSYVSDRGGSWAWRPYDGADWCWHPDSVYENCCLKKTRRNPPQWVVFFYLKKNIILHFFFMFFSLEPLSEFLERVHDNPYGSWTSQNDNQLKYLQI